jgi:LysR family glycine cleavage system transcriptional activator
MPPLNALKAFEAAARHASFAAAAEELGVTPAAVAHQVKALEAWLGARLFIRRAQGLGLTELSRSVLPAFSDAFDALGQAVQALQGGAPRTQVNIAALPAIAQLWLAPLLPEMGNAFPALSASVHALETPPDLRRELFDFALFYVRDAPQGCRMAAIEEDVMFPVCTPALARQLRSPADLAGLPLLRDTSWTDDWACWLNDAGVTLAAAEAGPAFSLYSMAVQAALDGGGVLMGHAALVRRHIAAGTLVAPFAVTARTGKQLAVLTPAGTGPRVTALLAWLVGSGARSAPLPSTPVGRPR